MGGVYCAQMDPQSHAFSRMSSFGTIEAGSILHSEGKTRLDCGDREACVQLRFKRKSPSVFLPGLLGAAFISLAVVYFLLRCFVLLRGGSRPAPPNRSLAAGSGRKCHSDGEDEEAEKDGEHAGGEEFWIGDAERTSSESQAAAAVFEHSVWQKGDTRRWPSMPAIASPGGLVQGRERGREHARATVGAEKSVGMLEQQRYGERKVGDLQYLQSRKVPQPCPGGLKEGDDETEEMNTSRLLQGETLQMWEHRSLPFHNEMNLISVFSRMMEAASACRLLLRRLAESERLRLSFQVMRLLALELGAFSLVREHLEYFRSSLGDAILQLGIDALTGSGTSGTLPTTETYRAPIREVIAVVVELKKPRPKTENNVPSRYRKKMVSLLQTATPVVGYCLGVVEGLLNCRDGESTALPPCLVEQQINVLMALYNVHSAQVAMDASLRHYIIRCQNRTKIHIIFGGRHLQLAEKDLPPLLEMVRNIQEAVEGAGGLVLTPPPARLSHDTPVAIPSRTSQHLQTLEPRSGTARDTQPHESFTAGLQPYPRSTGVAEFQSLQASASSSRLPHPILQQFSLGRPAPHYHPPQPLSPPFPHHGFIPLASRGHPESHSSHSTSPQVTAKTIIAEEAMLQVPALASERESGSSTRVPEQSWAARQGPAHGAQPYRQPSRSAFLGANANVEVPGYPRHGGYGASDQSAQPPLLPPAARPIEQPPGGAFSWDYGIASSGVSHQHKAEEEEVGGLLRELLKGGVDSDYVFGKKKLSDQ